MHIKYVCMNWTKVVCVNDHEVEFKLDSGAEVNILLKNILKHIAPQTKIAQSNISLMSYGNPNFRIKSLIIQVKLSCRVKNVCANLTFVIVEAEEQISLLGLQKYLALNLIRRVDAIDKIMFKS